MTKAEAIYDKMLDRFEEEGKGNVFLSSLTWKELDLKSCNVSGDVLTLGFTDGTEQYFTVTEWDTAESGRILKVVDKTDRKQEIAHLF